MNAHVSSFVLFRILGNDLPPRHEKGQTYENVKFIIKHEPFFKDCSKLWILNKIVDRKQEQRIIDLMESEGQKYLRLEFDREKYEKLKHASREKKIQYVIDVNRARNVALREGSGMGRWILPFDGNCFFSQRGWELFASTVADAGDVKYLVVPMARLVNNSDVLDQGYEPDVTETWTRRDKSKERSLTEPQIAFRNDAEDSFDENFIYGVASKAELLWRLGVPGMWDSWLGDLRDKSLQRKSADFKKYMVSGYVYRLCSGNTQAERDSEKRKFTREAGIDILINNLESPFLFRAMKNIIRRSSFLYGMSKKLVYFKYALNKIKKVKEKLLRRASLFNSQINTRHRGSKSHIKRSTYSRKIWEQYCRQPYTHAQIADCSFAGYRNGDVTLPNRSVVADVKTFGARGDGIADDTRAIIRAIQHISEKGGGAVFFPPGTYQIDRHIHLYQNGIVLRGAGPDVSILDFRNSLDDTIGTFIKDTGQSQWAWSGGQLWIGPKDTFDHSGKVADSEESMIWEFWRPGYKLARVLKEASKGDDYITVDSVNGISEGSMILLVWENPPDYSLLKHVAGHKRMRYYNWESANRLTYPYLPLFIWPVRVKAVTGNVLTLQQPIRLDIQSNWSVKAMEIGGHVKENGIEDLTIQLHAPYSHVHYQNKGWNGIYFNRAYDCWVKNVRISNAENGVIVSSSKNITVTDLLLNGESQHHHSLACRAMSHDVLFNDFIIDGPNRVIHGVNVEYMSSGNVWSKGIIKRGTLDSHHGLPFDNIRTELVVSNDAQSMAGSTKAFGPFFGKRMAYWNIRIEGSDREHPGQYIYQPESFSMGALVGIQGAPLYTEPNRCMVHGDKNVIVADHGKIPEPKNLYEAQVELRRSRDSMQM